jgi:hypothetical protein
MALLDHPCGGPSGLKVICDVCGNPSIKAIDPANTADGANVHCRRCDAVRGTVADLRAMARQANGDFEF